MKANARCTGTSRRQHHHGDARHRNVDHPGGNARAGQSGRPRRLLWWWLLDTWETTAPKLAAWAADAVLEAFAVFALPVAHRRCLRPSNALERVNKELKRRTRVATLFPSAASCERLVTAVAMEISEDWIIGRIYLDMTEQT